LWPVRAAPAARVVVHWKPLPDDEVVGHVTHPLRTVLDRACALPFPEALAVADSALRQGWLRPERLLAAAERRRGPGRARCLAVARSADARPHNGFESVLRGHLLEGGVGDLALQHAVPLPAFTAHVDLADVGRRIAVEADSYTYHANRTAFTDDCERYDQLGVAGWLVLRFTWERGSGCVLARRPVSGGCSSAPRRSSGCRAGGSP
jgi:very-short-patch-repair endonuclease